MLKTEAGWKEFIPGSKGVVEERLRGRERELISPKEIAGRFRPGAAFPGSNAGKSIDGAVNGLDGAGVVESAAGSVACRACSEVEVGAGLWA